MVDGLDGGGPGVGDGGGGGGLGEGGGDGGGLGVCGVWRSIAKPRGEAA